MEQFAYFSLRIRLSASGILAGTLERLGTAERHDFETGADMLARLAEMSTNANMRPQAIEDKQQENR